MLSNNHPRLALPLATLSDPPLDDPWCVCVCVCVCVLLLCCVVIDSVQCVLYVQCVQCVE